MATRKKRGAQPAPPADLALLWGEQPAPSRGPKPGLTLEALASAGIRIADAEGLEGISMQRVGAELGYAPMSLYRYVPGKAELISLMIDWGVGSPPALDRVPGGWRPRMELWARRLWEAFQRHPWALAATDRLRRMGPNELAWLDAALGALAETGLTGRALLDAFLVVNGQVRIAAQYSVAPPRGGPGVTNSEWTAAVGDLLQRHGDRYPALTALLAAGAPGLEAEDPLAAGLGYVLDGIEARIARPAKGNKRRR